MVQNIDLGAHSFSFVSFYGDLVNEGEELSFTMKNVLSQGLRNIYMYVMGYPIKLKHLPQGCHKLRGLGILFHPYIFTGYSFKGDARKTLSFSPVVEQPYFLSVNAKGQFLGKIIREHENGEKVQ